MRWESAAVGHVRAAVPVGWRPQGCGVMVGADFFFPFPQSTRKAVRLGVPRWRRATPDVDKLVRALLDVLSGVVIADDRQVVKVSAAKFYDSGAGRVEVKVSGVDGCWPLCDGHST